MKKCRICKAEFKPFNSLHVACSPGCALQVARKALNRDAKEKAKEQRKWVRELEEQGDMRAEEYRAYSKAYFGVPILLAENDAFAEQYTAIVKPLPYDQKLEIMRQPIDLPITRIMTAKQKKQYLMMYIHTGLARATC